MSTHFNILNEKIIKCRHFGAMAVDQYSVGLSPEVLENLGADL